ncbi:MAG: YfcE family phosphodiesterase [Oscillospiraceae bacterium]
MKYLIISDTHGYKNYLKRILEKEADINDIIYLGDGLNDILTLKAQNPQLNIIAVAGNCDVNKAVATQELIEVKGFKILICHGDGYSVKMSLLPLRKACLSFGASIALYGHTHQQYYEYFDGLYMFCPGSVMPSANPFSCYGILDFTTSKPLFYHKEI